MRCQAVLTCFATGCGGVVLCLPVHAAAADPVWSKATESPLFADGFEVGDPSVWTRSEPNGVSVSGVEPDNGVAGGGEMLTITGGPFTGTSDVQIDGVSCISWLVVDDGHISCETPPHEPAFVRLTVWRDGGHGTLTAGFRFTGEDDFLAVTWAALHWPPSVSCSAGVVMETITGRASAPGFTDPAGPPGSSVVAEVGWGPPATHPGRDPGWVWVDAPWFADIEGGPDEFRVAPTCPTAAVWALAFRCSADGGLTYLYGDSGVGTADGFDVSDLVVLVSQ